MCGIYGLSSCNPNKYIEIIEGIFRLQHRGQDGFGIGTSKKILKEFGLIKNINIDKLKEDDSYFIIGHVRYTTSGTQNISQIQPLNEGLVTLVHNGNIINKNRQ